MSRNGALIISADEKTLFRSGTNYLGNQVNLLHHIWVVAEQSHGKISRTTYELLTRGLTLAQKSGRLLCVMAFGENFSAIELQSLINHGADGVLVIESPELKHFQVETYAACIQEINKKYQPEIILAAASTTGRSLMPYAAMLLHAGLTADCTLLDIDAADGSLLQTRPAAGGNIMATIKSSVRRPQMVTVRPHAVEPAPFVLERSGEIIRLALSPELLNRGRMTFEKFVPSADECRLQDADKVVVVGRGIKKAENISLVSELATAIGAALGASREVVDRGWLSYPHQVGLSGKTITPKLYIGVGVSGAVQHLAGMQTAEKIIAVNSDAEAPIFQVADLGIVGDLFDIMPILTKRVKKEGLTNILG